MGSEKSRSSPRLQCKGVKGLELELRATWLQLLHLLRTYYVLTILGNRTEQAKTLISWSSCCMGWGRGK